MKIFDCFMYFDEEIVLDLRLNTLNDYIDYFVVVESTFTHKGDERKLKFNHEKFKKFEKKIIYLVYDKRPSEIEEILDNDSHDEKSRKYILNAAYRENGQRNFIINGLQNADDDDLILISDVDEIPNLENLDQKIIDDNIILFKQDMFYYRFNLKLPNLIWTGTKACKRKMLQSPQWLRNIKDRIYPWWRIDTFLSKTKFSNIKIFDNGGWHFSYIKSPENIEKKLKSYLHHTEYELNPLGADKITDLIKERKTVYNLKVDSRSNKFNEGNKLKKLDTNLLPEYVKNNISKFNEWIEK